MFVGMVSEVWSIMCTYSPFPFMLTGDILFLDLNRTRRTLKGRITKSTVNVDVLIFYVIPMT